ncbi:hypothetical protein [Hansschlegelia plantiphila]|uniref:Uncharacterized protein n=1 Tax=Hansschlegelia plantiphila TaxID=374655 RepID=A0A9W6J1J2_9HYPH|nr:hypothetical protein [Hansschlegelia plantiphila]GLK67673.1 hypothetical protein GCM10008179_13110 [Hansschlegelia plantiphila]
MIDKPPGAFELAKEAFSGAAAAARAMPALFLVSFLLFAAASWFTERSQPADPKDALAVASLLPVVVFGAIVSSVLAVAVHRFYLLSERNGLMSLLERHSRTVAEFMVTMLAFNFILIITMQILRLGDVERPLTVLIAFLLFVVVCLVFLYGMLRLSLIFPAIAVETPGRSLASAYRAGRGLVWRQICAGALLAVPLFVLPLAARLALAGSPAGAVAAALVRGAATLALTAVFVVLASRLFVWRQERWNGTDAFRIGAT